MATVKEVYHILDDFAPFSTQMSFDNAGFLVGRGEREVTKILVALDITLPVVEEAAALGAELIVAHHPVIFNPVKSVTDGSVTGEIILRLAEAGIAAICAHTSLDGAQGGVNDCLAQCLQLEDITMLEIDGIDSEGRPYGIGRVGTPHEVGLTAQQYAAFVSERLSTGGVRYCQGRTPVSHVAVGGGSCGSMLRQAVAAGCDTFVTGDVKHDVFLEASALGITLIDGGHGATERVVCPTVQSLLQEQLPQVEVVVTACGDTVVQGV